MVRLRHYVNAKGWNSQAHEQFPGKFESTNLSFEILSMETGRRGLIDLPKDERTALVLPLARLYSWFASAQKGTCT